MGVSAEFLKARFYYTPHNDLRNASLFFENNQVFITADIKMHYELERIKTTMFLGDYLALPLSNEEL
jgi:hypothetical protein